MPSRKPKKLKTLLAELDRRETELNEIEDRVRNLDSRYKAVWAALNDDKPLPPTRKPTTRGRKQRSPSRDSMGVDVADVDLAGAETRFDQLVRIAEVASNNEVNLYQATKLLVAAGVVPADGFQNCRTALHNTVRRYNNCFKHVRRGWYRYVQPRAVSVTPIRWRDGAIDYSDDANLDQRLVKMAEHAADGRLEPVQTAERLLTDGKSSQRLDSLARLVRQTLRKSPRFRKLGDECFELVGSEPGVPDAHLAGNVGFPVNGHLHSPEKVDE